MLSREHRLRHGGPLGILLGAAALAGCIAFVPARAQLAEALRTRREAGYVDSAACATCHRSIWDTYQKTGMGRSFYRPSPSNTVERNKGIIYYHKASESYFTVLERDGKYYQRRHQLDPLGKPFNVMEKQIDYVMGSGNHSRAYLSRTARNTLVELPLAWYSENGGYWAMNPGYDRPDHDGFRRPISYDCMFCHNAYPEIPDHLSAEPTYAESLPQGIDCQRCHGPGGKHVELAKTAGSTAEVIRRSVVNPSRLKPQRQIEVCMQCHLETTSFPLPNAIQRFGRSPFSFRPGEPLSDFILLFDHAPGTGREEKLEIVSSAYRLRRSACFLKSSGRLSCTTCHNPHDIPRGEAATEHYSSVCKQCHAGALDLLVASGKHPQATLCIDCHMPKRRTEDVVHVAVTDHYIQRRKPPGDLLAELPERHETDQNAYRGPVVPYYPEILPHTPENDLYLGIAQVNQRSNLDQGIRQLTSAIARSRSKRFEPYLELAEAWRSKGELAKALPFYREAVRKDPTSAVLLQKLGSALRRSGKFAEAAESLKRATTLDLRNPVAFHELGLTYQALGKTPEAISALENAVHLDPDLPEAFNNLGVIWSAKGDQTRAEAALREAIRIQPDHANAQSNLGNLLAAAGDFMGAQYHFESALRLRPNDAATHYSYAMALGRNRQFDRAENELNLSLQADPNLADAQQLLGDLLMAKGQAQQALPHYREAVRIRPASGRARVGLAGALIAVGDRAAGIAQLESAASDSDAAVREEAVQALRNLGVNR